MIAMDSRIAPSAYDSAECGRVILRDSRAAAVRIARPEDREALRDFFERLSPESRRRRFGSMAPPGPGLIALLCNDSDPRSALTLVAGSSGKNVPSVIATGSYVAKDKRTVEVALAVADAFQGKGLGTLLLKRLTRLAVRNGFTHIWAVTHVDNRPMQHVLRESGLFVEERLQGDQIEMDLSVVPFEPRACRR
jgi:acetate---CoA ligase (ADP-forming)